MKTIRKLLTAILICLAAGGIAASAATPLDPGENAMSVVYESADILSYENGWPYIHGVLTNNTDKTISQAEYCMLAYDENGAPLKLHWNFLDSSEESSYAYLVRKDGMALLPGQTEDYRGGWSLYDGGAVSYALLGLKQVVFADGTVWDNPDYESWLASYAGKEAGAEDLQNYYPRQYGIE